MSSPYRELHVPVDATKKKPWVIYIDANTRIVETGLKQRTHPHFVVETKGQDSIGEMCWLLIDTIGPQSGQNTLYKVLDYLRGTR